MDGFFQFFARERTNVEIGLVGIGEKSGSLIVAVNALRLICTRSFGVPGGNTNGRAMAETSCAPS